MALHDDQVSLPQRLDSTRRALYLAARRSRLIDLDRLREVLTVDLPESAANLGRILASRG